MKKRILCILLSLFLLLSVFLFNGCQKGEGEEQTSVSDLKPMDEKQQKVLKAFQSALSSTLSSKRLPDGGKMRAGSGGTLSENSFCLADVDGDGETELLFYYSSAQPKDRKLMIYARVDGTNDIRLEYSGDLSTTVYEDGVLRAPLTENRGVSASFEPYHLYRYDSKKDEYVLQFSVDAWDGNTYPQDSSGKLFPKKKAVDGKGFIHYIQTPDGKTKILDSTRYLKWEQENVGHHAEQLLQYSMLTRENIRSIF